MKKYVFLLTLGFIMTSLFSKVEAQYCGEIWYTAYFDYCTGGSTVMKDGCEDCKGSCQERSNRVHHGSCYASGNACWDTYMSPRWYNNRCYAGGQYGKGRVCKVNMTQPIACGSQPSCTCSQWDPIKSCGDQCGAKQRLYQCRTTTPAGCSGGVGNRCFNAAECSGPPPTSVPPTATPTPANVNVVGQVFDASAFSVNPQGQCLPAGGSGIKPGGGSSVAVSNWTTGANQGSGGAINNNGTYAVNNVPSSGTKRIQLSGIDPAYGMLCPGSGQYGPVTVSSLPSGWNMIVTSILPLWGQVQSGMVHAQGGAMVAIPATKYFITDPNHGVATRLSGNQFVVSPGTLSPVTVWEFNEIFTNTRWRYGYAAFWQRAGNPMTALPGNGTNAPPAGIWRHDGNVTISGTWTNLSGSRVIFVNGDAVIDADITLSGTSDFFAIIAAGDITVNPAVGDAVKATPTAEDADLVGFFAADGNWYGCPLGCVTTNQLVIHGSIAADADLSGNGNVRFGRDLGSGNAVGPGVSVIWNSNLLLSVDQSLKEAVTEWTGEVAP